MKFLESNKMLKLLLNNCIYVSIILMGIYYNLKFSNISNFTLKMIIILSYTLCIIYCYTKLKIKKFLWFLLGLVCVYMISYRDNKFMALYLISIMINDDSKFNRSLLCIFYVNLIVLIFLPILGFGNNAIAIQIGICIMQSAYIFEKNINIFIICSYFIILVIGFIITNAGQLLICGGIFILFLLLNNRFSFELKETRIYYLVIPIIVVSNFLSSYFLSNNFKQYCPKIVYLPIFYCTSILDRLLSYRLSLTKSSLELFGCKLIGNAIDLTHPSIQYSYFFIDSSYCQLLQYNGIIPFLITIILLTYNSVKIIYKSNILFFVSITVALWSINEGVLLMPHINVSILYIGISVRLMIKRIGEIYAK